jgi:coronin-1B/1C/6
MKDNQNSMSEMANKFADKDAESSDDEPSSPFEEIPKPIQRPTSTVGARQEQKVGVSEPPKHSDLTPTPVATASAPEPSRAPAPSSRNVSESQATPSAPAPAADQPSADTSSAAPSRSASSAAGGLKEVLGEIRGLLQAQSKQIEALTNEVAELKARVN